MSDLGSRVEGYRRRDLLRDGAGLDFHCSVFRVMGVGSRVQS